MRRTPARKKYYVLLLTEPLESGVLQQPFATGCRLFSLAEGESVRSVPRRVESRESEGCSRMCFGNLCVRKRGR